MYPVGSIIKLVSYICALVQNVFGTVSFAIHRPAETCERLTNLYSKIQRLYAHVGSITISTWNISYKGQLINDVWGNAAYYEDRTEHIQGVPGGMCQTSGECSLR